MRRETPCWDALAARQHQDFSRHSAAPPTAHILAEGDRTAGLTISIYAATALSPHFSGGHLNQIKKDAASCCPAP